MRSGPFSALCLCMIAVIAGAHPATAQSIGDMVKSLGFEKSAAIELSARQLPNPQTVKELFKIDATEGPAKDYLAQIKARCGWLDPLVLDEFKKLNGVADLTVDLSDRKTLQYPACVKYTPSTEIVQKIGKAPAADDLSKKLETVLNASKDLAVPHDKELAGASAEIIKKQLEAANLAVTKGITAASRQEAFKTATTDLAQRIIKDPTLAAVTMRDGERGSVTVIPAASLARVGSTSGIDSLGDGSFYVSNIIEPATSPVSTADCVLGWRDGRASSYLNWPFNTSKLFDTLLLNASERVRRGRSLKTVPVMIADTGFDVDLFLNPGQRRSHEPQFFFSSEDFFAIDDDRQLNGGLPLVDKNGDDLPGVLYGFSVDNNSADIGTIASYQFKDHGMGVASLVLGGMQLYRYRMLRSLPIRLHFANLMVASSPPGMTNKELARLISYAAINDIEIVNMSFESKQTIRSLRDELERNPRMLAIVAAGNSGVDLQNQARYPAKLGGELWSKGGSVLTVGAHREDGSVADFSNWNSDYVDVLAPGCFIPVPKRNNSEQIVVEPEHGTSFAAPIVTFVSALLKAEGLKVQDVKRRIVITAEHDEKRGAKARFGAKLDPEAALTLYNDIVDETVYNADGTKAVLRSKGRLNLNAKIPFAGGCSERELGTIYRMDRVGPSAESAKMTYRVFFSNNRDGVASFEMPRNCEIGNDVSPKIQFYDSAALKSRTIALIDIQTLMVRER